MSPEVDRTRYQLSEERNERIFRDDIVPTELPGTPQRHPVVVFVAGQTGAGKTSVTHLVEAAIARRGAAVNIDFDTYKPYHPRYQRLVENDDTTAGAYTSIDGHKWMDKAEAYAIGQRYERNRSWSEPETHRLLGNLQRLRQLAEQLPEAAQPLARPEAVAVADLAGQVVDPNTRARAAGVAASMPQPDADLAVSLASMSHPGRARDPYRPPETGAAATRAS